MLVPVTVSLGMAQVYQRSAPLPPSPPSGVPPGQHRTAASQRPRMVGANRYTRPGTGCSAVWLARRVWVAEVAGSNPASPTTRLRPALSCPPHTPHFGPERAG